MDDVAAPVDTLLARLGGVRRVGADRWMARCPAHADRRASLSVRVTDDGRVLVHCFAACGVAEIVRACGLDLADLFPPRGGETHHAPRVRRPYSAHDAIRALRGEMYVVWVLLADIAAGTPIDDAARRRALLARRRCIALLDELGDG